MTQKTRPGIERIEKQVLQGCIAAAKQVFKYHDKHCRKCNDANGDVYARCSDWWRAAISSHRAKQRLAQYNDGPMPGEVMLPGMEEVWPTSTGVRLRA